MTSPSAALRPALGVAIGQDAQEVQKSGTAPTRQAAHGLERDVILYLLTKMGERHRSRVSGRWQKSKTDAANGDQVGCVFESDTQVGRQRASYRADRCWTSAQTCATEVWSVRSSSTASAVNDKRCRPSPGTRIDSIERRRHARLTRQQTEAVDPHRLPPGARRVVAIVFLSGRSSCSMARKRTGELEAVHAFRALACARASAAKIAR
jgi:hypothetical protein